MQAIYSLHNSNLMIFYTDVIPQIDLFYFPLFAAWPTQNVSLPGAN